MESLLKILVVDDELPARNRLKEILQDVSDSVSLSVVAEASDGLKAITLLNDTAIDIVLLDIRMPGMDGIEVARHAQNLAHPPAVIFTTAFDAYAVKAFELNVADEGGLDKIFAMTLEIGKTLPPEQTGGVPTFANATPESLRTMASAGVYMAAEQSAQVAPGFKDLITPFGAFIEKGGKVKFTMKPAKPVSVADIMAREDIRNGATAPAQLLAEFNAKTVHTPAGPLKP